MSYNRNQENIQWLQTIIDRNYAQVVHDLVTEKFKNRPVKCDNDSIKSDDGYLSPNTGEEDFSESDFSLKSTSPTNERSILQTDDEESEEDLYESSNKTFFSLLGTRKSEFPERTTSKVLRSETFSVRNEETCYDSQEDDGFEETFANYFVTKFSAEEGANFDYSAIDHLLSESEKSSGSSSCISRVGRHYPERTITTGQHKNEEDYVQYEEAISKIYSEEQNIDHLKKLLKKSKRSKGYVGSVPHIAACKNLTISNITKQAMIASLARNYYFPSSEDLRGPKGRITVAEPIHLDTDHIGAHGTLPPCYYMVVILDENTILNTEPMHPDQHGLVKFPGIMALEEVNRGFSLRLCLYKLPLAHAQSSGAWRVVFSKKNPQPSVMECVGEIEISRRNINTTSFHFDQGEILYMNFATSIDTGRPTLRTHVELNRLTRQKRNETRLLSWNVWAVLQATELKFFNRESALEPLEVLQLTQCKSCNPYQGLPNTLMLDLERSHSRRLVYLSFHNKSDFEEWLKAINYAISVSNEWVS